jgi:hypothetical protein
MLNKILGSGEVAGFLDEIDVDGYIYVNPWRRSFALSSSLRLCTLCVGFNDENNGSGWILGLF